MKNPVSVLAVILFASVSVSCGIIPDPGETTAPEISEAPAVTIRTVPGFILSRPVYTPGSFFEAFAPEPAAGYTYTLHLLDGDSLPESDSDSDSKSADLSRAREIPGIALEFSGEEGDGYGLFYFYSGFHTWMPPGDYTLRLRYMKLSDTDREKPKGDDPAFTRDYSLRISDRQFAREEIYLNRQLTNIRTDESPRRIAETETLNQLLLSSDPSARHIQLSEAGLMPLDHIDYTSGFGDRRTYRYQDGNEAYSIHNGLDFRAAEGTPVIAPFSGEVVMADDRIVSGKTVVLEHLPGVYTMYYHLHEIDVAEGTVLKSGEQLGTAGKTGLSTGSHLHWELRIMGAAVDPRDMLNSPLLDKQRRNFILYGD